MRLFLIGLLVDAIMVIINGVAVMLLWDWYITPLGAPAIDFVGAVGICLLATVLATKRVPPGKGESVEEAAIASILHNLVVLAFCVTVGFIFHLFA